MSSLRNLLQEAVVALREGRARDAQDACDRVLAIEPAQFDALRLRAVACDALADRTGVLVALRRAHALRPADAGCASDLGAALLEDGDAASARPLLERASDALRDDARVAFRLGRACAALDDPQAACVAFAAAAARDPAWAQAWMNLAVMQHRAGRLDDALDAAQTAVEVAPDEPEAHRTLAALASHRFDVQTLQRGRRHATRALELDPAHADAHADAALLARKTGDLRVARDHAERAVALAPGNEEHVVLLGETLSMVGDAAAAVHAFESARSRGLAGHVLQRQHAIALLQAGDPARALALLQGCVEHDPTDQRAIAHLGVALASLGRVDDAVDWLGLDRHVHAIDFPVPAGFADLDAFHHALARDVAHHSRQRWEPAGLAARSAFLSGELSADDTPAIRGFLQALRAQLDTFRGTCRSDEPAARGDPFLRAMPHGETLLHAWSTLAPAAGHIDTHIHEQSWLSGAYYLEVPPSIHDGDPDQAGWIEFGRPFGTLPPAPQSLLRSVCPRPGLLLLFPSYLFHRTRPFEGPGVRISLSFDLREA